MRPRSGRGNPLKPSVGENAPSKLPRSSQITSIPSCIALAYQAEFEFARREGARLAQRLFDCFDDSVPLSRPGATSRGAIQLRLPDNLLGASIPIFASPRRRALALLQPVKGVIVALQWRLGCTVSQNRNCGPCPDCEARQSLRHARMRASKSKDANRAYSALMLASLMTAPHFAISDLR
jgi:hypothetical protein